MSQPPTGRGRCEKIRHLASFTNREAIDTDLDGGDNVLSEGDLLISPKRNAIPPADPEVDARARGADAPARRPHELCTAKKRVAVVPERSRGTS